MVNSTRHHGIIDSATLEGAMMIGQRLNDRYQVTQHIGDGTTATVYRALDTKLHREVALKVLLPHVRETTHSRFFQEAKSVAQLNHPNIMTLYDIGEDAGRHYLVVEYIRGNPLTDYVPSAGETVAKLSLQIARALGYAADKGIIHRDIKPANIHVTPDGAVKIMDLGLALPPDSKRYTATGMVVGTPAYLSPEQAQGNDLDTRSDIYSLGVVMYELATGKLPFNADNLMALLLQHIQQSPKPPQAFAPELPDDLNRLILKALEKDPADRYQDGFELASDLELILGGTGESVSVSNVDSPYPDPDEVIGVVLADDHSLMRRMIANFLADYHNFAILAEAGDGIAALEQTIDIQPDLLLLDLNMPYKNGLEIIPDIREKCPHTKVLVLTGREDEGYIVRALRAGAHGYILKSIDERELIRSIEQVMAGEMVFGHGIVDKAISGLLSKDGDVSHLSEQECNLLLYVAAGYQNDSIAQQMDVTVSQVIESLASVMDKLNASDRNGAALAALRRGDITLEELHHLPPQKL